MRIVVAGGTGLVGRLVVEEARKAGHEPVVLSRSTGADLVTGEGVDALVDGAAAVIDVSNVVTLSGAKARAFFTTATDRLLEAGRRAGVSHHVALSIVGVDRVPWGYYQAKRAQEERVLAGPVGATVLRATQFHEFAAQMLDRPGPVAAVPRMKSQPVAAAEVAAALVRIVAEPPVGLAPELAGPEVHWMPDLARRLARARGKRRLVLPLWIPGKAGHALAGGGLLPTAPGPRGTVTFDQWVQHHS